MRKVTWLEPRTPHQPGKPQNVSKNDFLFTLLILGVNEKCRILSPYDAIKCSPSTYPCYRTGATLCLSILAVSAVGVLLTVSYAVPLTYKTLQEEITMWKSQRDPWMVRE